MLLEVLGWVGCAEVIVALFIASAGLLPATSRWFRLLNVSGSLFIAVNSAAHHAYASVFTNLVIVACIGFLEFGRLRRSTGLKVERRAGGEVDDPVGGGSAEPGNAELLASENRHAHKWQM